MSESIECQSRISRVVVYARGAVVTRLVELPVGLPTEGCELVVGDITPLAEPGSIRTGVDGERAVTGIQAPLAWAKPEQPKPVDEDAVRSRQREARRVQLRRERVQYRVNYLQGMAIQSDLQVKRRPDQPPPGINERLGAAMGTADLVHDLLAQLEIEQRELQDKAEKLANEIDALRRRPPVHQPDGPQRQVRVNLAPGSDHLRALEISYRVDAARWWPAYSARLTNGGKNTEFSVEAFVAQSTLEDWKDARISLCTADMVSDLTLPELQSLRLGRRQQPKQTGFREPPEGLDAMFEAHDTAFGGPGSQPSGEDMIVFGEPPEDMDEAIAEVAVGASAQLADAAMDDYYEEEREESKSKRGRSGAPAKKAAKAEMAPQSAPAPVAMSRSMVAMDGAFGGGAPAGNAMPATEPEPEAQGVDEQWLDYDSLRLAGPESHRRGRLEYSDAGRYQYTARARHTIEATPSPRGAEDPLYSRGMFDHQFDADGLVEIVSTGRAQRVRLLAKPARSRMAFRCVPLEDERVFREVEIENPLEAPLLPGPVDVFMDGALLITSEVNAVDRGGTIRFGLGEEQRVRVVRNVRAREETKGVFGGKIAMDHDISFEAASSLAGDIELELVDRLPVTDDKDIDVELLKSEPKAEKYAQDERHSHVRGGLRWKLPLKAGATTKVQLTYRIGFDKDFELNGGNRRD
ncbi:MAG: DUF4139 domain-containing protein [Planctomycetes bacterium]|nr:DUF4139 domain-containing protein [Planctomycetota bacterium]